MTTSLPWYTQPLFVSSTFSDMNAERDHLRDIVFPELSERLRERRHHLEPIDLRWGVETMTVGEQAEKELLVLKVCLNEIERCRPFFIGMLGDRYGWIPPEKRMQAAIDEKKFSTKVQGKSVTALEIEFGVLASRDQKKRSFFYYRKPLPYAEMPLDVAARFSDEYSTESWAPDAVIRLQELKQDILKKVTRGRVREYEVTWDSVNNKVTGLEAWGQQVLEDLWKELDDKTRSVATLPAPAWQDQERAYLDTFIEEHSRGFVGRSEMISCIKAMALSSDAVHWGICVAAEPGMGKSALFAKLVRELENEKCLILAHAAGISMRSTGVDAILRRWIQELAAHLELNESDPSKALETLEEKKEMFAELFLQTSMNKRIIILVDALNQLEPTSTVRHMNWLPEIWPENARLVCTAIPGEETEALEKRQGIKSLKLEPTDINDAKEIIHTICRQYHKSIHGDVVNKLVNKKQDTYSLACGNPLWLSMAVEALILLDEDDFARTKSYKGSPEEKLHALMLASVDGMPGSVEGLYGYLFERAEKRFGKNWLRSILCFLTVSRFGLREEDLKAIIPFQTDEAWDDLRFATFRRYFRVHLEQKGEQGLWDFSHKQVRTFLEQDLMKNENHVITLHCTIANHLHNMDASDPLHQTEIMFHMMKGNQKQKAANYLGNVDLSENEKKGAIKILSKALSQKQNKEVVGSQWAEALLKVENLENDVVYWICTRYQCELLDALSNDAVVKTRLHIIHKVVKTSERIYNNAPESAKYARSLSVSYSKLGDIYLELGDPKTALKHWQSCLRIREELFKRVPDSLEYAKDVADAYIRVGNSYQQLDNPETALGYYQSCLEIRENLCNRVADFEVVWEDLSIIYEKLGDLYLQVDDPQTAFDNYQNFQAIAEKLCEQFPNSTNYLRGLSIAHDKLGGSCFLLGDSQSALNNYQSSITIIKKLCNRFPDSIKYIYDLSIHYDKMGLIYAKSGDTLLASNYFKKNLKIIKDIRRRLPDSAFYAHDMAVASLKLFNLYLRQLKYMEFYKYYKLCFDTLITMRKKNMYMDKNLKSMLFSLIGLTSSVILLIVLVVYYTMKIIR